MHAAREAVDTELRTEITDRATAIEGAQRPLPLLCSVAWYSIV